jgi:hypothetical protein
MSQRHPIDVFFRRRLAKYDAGAPMHIWDKIQAHQQRRRQLRRLYWLGTSVSAVALLIFLAYPKTDPANSGLSTHNGVGAVTESAPVLPAAPDKASAGKAFSSQPATAPDDATNLPSFSQPVAAAASKTAGATAVRPVGGQAELQPDIRMPIAGTAEVYSTGAQPQESESTPVLAEADSYANSAETTDLPVYQPAAPYTPATVGSEPTTAPVHIAAEDNYGSRMTGPHVRAHTQWVAPLPPARQAQSHLSTTPDWHHFKPSTGCAGLQIRSPHWGLEILGGPLAAYQGLSARTPEQESYLSMRKATERNRFSLGTQFRLLYQMPAGLRLRLGVQYLHVNQLFTYENPDIMEIRIVPQLGNNGEIIGSDTIYTPVLHHTNNRYQWVNIPLLVGYEFKKNKLRLGALVGPVFNLRFDATGEMIAPDSRLPATFGNKGESVTIPAYRTHAGIGWYGGINASINIYGRYSLFTEASVQRFHRSITVADYPLTHQPWIGSMLLGLRTRL